MSSPPQDSNVVLLTDPLFIRHETGSHPESPRRLKQITVVLEKSGLLAACRQPLYKPATIAQIAAVHDATVAERARAVAEAGGGMLDADTIVSAASYEVALAAAGACITAVDEVIRGPQFRALCLIRPPGHHATPSRSMGFCLFNNIAVAAQHARQVHGLTRILIVDWDVHHGNGTQDIFYADGGIAVLNIHRYGHGFYPGTGAWDETGTGRGLGLIRNVPMSSGTSRRDYLERFKTELGRFADQVRPELILLSAGFDAHHADPIGALSLETEDFTDMTRFLLDVAKTHAKGRLVSCLEGGYNVTALAECVQTHLDELLHYSTTL